MKRFARPIVALMGLLSLATALGLWFAMDGLLPQLGIAPNDLASGLVGRATVRADIAGMFGGMGLAMLIAAQRLSRSWTNAVLIFASTAITGRIVSLILDGAPAIVWPPIAIEAIAIAVLLWFRSSLPAGRL
jgi:hypothetical protein